MDTNALTQLTGTALAIGVLIYMVHYFMRREEKREDFIAKVVQDNTNAIRELKDMIMNQAKRH